MPNWCENILQLKHSNKSKLEEALQAFKDEKLLDWFVPMPDHIKLGGVSGYEMLSEDNWYGWRRKNWGTKWDAAPDLPGKNRRIGGGLARHGIHLRFIPANCVQCLPKQLFSLPFLGRQTIPTISRAMLIARANRTGRSIDIQVRTASPIGAVHIPNF